MVVSPHVLASEAGAAALVAGGSAVDAAIAAHAVLSVVYPHMTSLGGDAFWLIHDATGGKVRALVAGGRAPAAATLGEISRRGLAEIPPRSILAVTVPAAVDGWAEAHAAHGRLPFSTLLAPALGHARDGVGVTPKLARFLERNAGVLGQREATSRVFLPGGVTLRAGERLVQPDLARTLELLGRNGRAGFYEGEVAEEIVACSRAEGGLHTMADLAAPQAEWAEPIRGDYRGVTIFQTPPPSHGISALQMLYMLADDDVRALDFLSADHIHLLVEAKKVAFADRDRLLADPAFADVPVSTLLSREFARERRRIIRADRALPWDRVPAGSLTGDTVYVGAVDAEGNVASVTQSVYFAFGSGIVAGRTGVLLHNRGAYFSLDPAHPNRLEPRKRPLHTLMASIAFRDGQPWLAFGCMGADGQPQIHVQVYSALLDHGLDLAPAIDAPRWLAGRFVIGDAREWLSLEARVPPSTRAALEARGHDVKVLEPWDELTGHAHGILLQADGTRLGVADLRSDGSAVGP